MRKKTVQKIIQRKHRKTMKDNKFERGGHGQLQDDTHKSH